MDREKRIFPDTEEGAVLKNIPSVLESDYNGLKNKPTINGTELKGDLTSADIKVLPDTPDEYNDGNLEDSDGYFTVVNEDGEPTKIPVSEVSGAISGVDEKAEAALLQAEKAGTKFIGTAIQDGELVVITADYLDATFDINEWGHLEVDLGESNAKQVTKRVVGSMFYSGTADTAEEIADDIEAKGKHPLELDMYLCTGSGNLWQYQNGEFAVILTLGDGTVDGKRYATGIAAEDDGKNITLNLLNSDNTKISGVTLTMPYMTKEETQAAIDEKFEDGEKAATYQQVNVNKNGIVIDGANLVEYWTKEQAASDTLAVGGLAFADID